MVFSTRKKLAAIALGSLVTAAPVLLFNSWVTKQGSDEAALIARQAVSMAEARIDAAVAALSELSIAGVNSCRPDHLEALRQAAFRAEAVKEFSIVNAYGETLCRQPDVTTTWRRTVASTVTTQANIIIDVEQAAGRGDQLLRVRLVARDGRASVAASIPSGLLMVPATAFHAYTTPFVQLALADKTAIGTGGSDPRDKGDASLVATESSSRYGFTANVAMERDGLIANYEDLRRIGIVGTGMLSVLLLSLAVIVIRRGSDNPFADVARGLLANEFVPYYQPVVDIKSGQLIGAEVLVRWRLANGEIIGPDQFIPAMESSGLILEMTRSLMRQVRDELGATFAARPQLSLAFNVAPEHLFNSSLLQDVGSIFDESPLRFSQLVLELTERNRIDDMLAARRDIAALQGLGCRVAIDDVGTGHSGLSYILKLGVDIIKIDRIFVQAIGAGSESKAIMETLVDLAKNLRMEIIAEGVENFDQVAYLRDHGITSAQGFVFSPALPLHAFQQLIDAIDPMPLVNEPEVTKKPPEAARPMAA